MFGDRSKATFFFRKSQELDARSKRASYTPSTEVVRLCIYMYLYLCMPYALNAVTRSLTPHDFSDCTCF